MGEKQDSRDIQNGLLEVAIAIHKSSFQVAEQIGRLADAVNRIADQGEEYEEDAEPRAGQSLSDVG